MVLHVSTSFLGGVPLCIPYGLYSGTSLGGTTWRTLEGYSGRVLSQHSPGTMKSLDAIAARSLNPLLASRNIISCEFKMNLTNQYMCKCNQIN